MKDIELPMRVLVGDGVLNKVPAIYNELGLRKKPLVISGPNTHEVAGEKITDSLDARSLVLEDEDDRSMHKWIEKGIKIIKEEELSSVIGVGGGTVIDIAKVCAFKSKLPYASIPTAASHDGITSSQASIQGEKPVSIQVHAPVVIAADTEIIRKAPSRLLSAGCADAVSNFTAVLDWELAKKEKNEYFGDYAASLSMMSAKIVMQNHDKIKEDVSILVEALISSGVAMGIAGSSRPCSGAEHQFSHSLDLICPGEALHGEQCGVGTIMMAYLHNENWEKIRNVLEKLDAPVNAKDLGIDEECILEALTRAHEIRDRYTILRDGLSKEKAEEIATKTGVL